MALQNLLGNLALDASVQEVGGKIAHLVGDWGYAAGVDGILNVPAARHVLQITATAGTAPATMSINAGQSITIPPDSSLTIVPQGNLVSPAIVFDGTTAYFVEYVT